MKRNLATLLLLALLVGIPPLSTGYFNLSRAQKLRSQNPALASNYYEKAARLLFWEPGLLEQAGLAASEARDTQRAIQLLLQDRQKDSLSPTGFLALGELYRQQGNPGAAYAEAWLPLSQTGYSSSQLATRLAEYKESQRDFPGAVAQLREVLQIDPTNAWAYYRLGLLLTAENPEQALANLEKAAELDTSLQPNANLLRRALEQALTQPDLAYQQLVIGRALANLNEWQLALNAFQLSVQANPHYAEARAWLAEALYQTGTAPASEIESAFEKALTLNPASAGIHAMAGLYWQRQGQYGQAENQYRTATELEPENPAWWQALAGAVARRDLPAALEIYQHATALDSQNFSTWYALAAFCVENEAYLQDNGLEAALRAYALQPENPQAIDLLGRALALTGESHSARVMYEKALALAPAEPAPRFHLALLYLQMNLRAEAKTMLQETLLLDPAGPYGTQAKHILDRYFP